MSASLPPTSRLPLRCWAEIDLGALERNLQRIRASLPGHIRYVAVVKADAYGHGLPQTVARLMHAGADLFAVATLAEAQAIREISSDWPVLLLSPLLPEEDRALVEYDLMATLSSEQELRRFEAVAAATGKTIHVHLKVDTGMGRLGVWHENAAALCQEVLASEHVRLAGAFTHFASSDDAPEFTEEQRRRFTSALAGLPLRERKDLLIHADNSAGLETLAAAGPFNAVRVGLLQFGVLPKRDSLLSRVQAEPVMSFHTRVGLVKNLPAGTGISYGGTSTLTRNSRVAILTGGYGDGIPRAVSRRAEVLIRGQRCPILGRVTMDQTIVDVTDAPAVAVGDSVVLFGTQEAAEISVSEFSAWADTIPWETLCSVSKRVTRVYRRTLGL